MHSGPGQVAQVYLDGSARIDCAADLIPAPGQYLLAHADGSDAPLPAPLFLYDVTANGFRFAAPVPLAWRPGTQLNLRGPLGHGFTLPAAARKLALIAWDDSAARLRGLISIALQNNLEVVLACDAVLQDLPEVVEIQPLRAVPEACKWADFIAVDIARENLHQLKEMFGDMTRLAAAREAQVLVRAPVPCGGLAECGVCAVSMARGWRMTCRDGPVFNAVDLFGSLSTRS